MAIIDSSSEVLVSSDGINWNSYGLPVSSFWQMVRYANGKFIAAANNDNSAISTDGKNWSAVSIPMPNGMTSFVNSAFGNNLTHHQNHHLM